MVRVFQVVKSFCFTNVESAKKLCSSYFWKEIFSKFCKGAKLFKLFVVFEINLKCFPSSRFEPRSFAECLQNLLIEEKSVERLWRFSKNWT
jgi:hypothetical protein